MEGISTLWQGRLIRLEMLAQYLNCSKPGLIMALKRDQADSMIKIMKGKYLVDLMKIADDVRASK